jgi:HD-GYP domain-containing protein (c-di-GMP phosphodiesterase class II)
VCEHAYATGALSVAIAVRLGWSVWDVRAAGLAGLMADSGMMLLANDLRTLARPLTEIEWNAMRRHPAYSLALSAHVLEMPEIVPLAVYQHHEREDGSGYPLGLRTHAGGGGGVILGANVGPNAAALDRSPICDVARVVAVADVLAGASAPRAHRPRLTAHGAVQLAVREAAAGRLDKATVRAAVKAVGVFPAGSYVRLSSGQLALVESVHDPERADRPIVRLVETSGLFESEAADAAALSEDTGAGVLEFKPDVVDLCAPEASGLSVIEALEIPDDVTLMA